ncbi:MAG: hypothetical protein HY549_07525 [Elusimicrobia bacterium]|nr:hypothetical protein [Elusimicrobiota bacterium]
MRILLLAAGLALAAPLGASAPSLPESEIEEADLLGYSTVAVKIDIS